MDHQPDELLTFFDAELPCARLTGCCPSLLDSPVIVNFEQQSRTHRFAATGLTSTMSFLPGLMGHALLGGNPVTHDLVEHIQRD